MPEIDPVALTQALIRCPSVTPADAGALDVVQGALQDLGFACHRLRFAEPGFAAIDNLYARIGAAGPNFCFAGHTDVVPPGDPALWRFDPFAGEIAEGRLYGRGAADMKSAVAAFVAAAARFLDRTGPAFGGSVSLLITSDEEADAVNGTVKVLRWLAERGERLDACVVGEPTGVDVLGDTIKIGRRGSLNSWLTVYGTQGHTAYGHLADNPLPRLVRMLAALTAEPLDAGTPDFAPSTVEITSIEVGNPASNVIPAQGRAAFNIRFNDRHTGTALQQRIRALCDGIGGRYDLRFQLSGESFLTAPGPLTAAVAGAVARVTGRPPALGTGGGTSDARFIKDYCPVVECGPVGRTIHKADEYTDLDDIARLTEIYAAILETWFADRGC